jgi:AcrR family transcriptional regulator
LQQRGLIPPDVDPRSMLLSSRMLSHARLLDDLDPRPVPHLDWVAVSCRFHDGLLDARSVEAPDPAVRRSTERLRALIRPTDVTGDGGGSPGVEGDADADPRVATVVARARELLVVGGVAAVQVGRIRSELGLSAGWFHRAVGDRDALLDAARLDLLNRSLSAEVRSFAALVQHARSPEELVAAVVDWIADPPRDPMSARLRWQRTDLLVAARLRPGLGHEAGLVIGRLTDAMTEVVVEAQARGLLRPDLAPRAVARFAHATVYGAMLIELDGRPVDVATWRHTLRRGLRPLTH